MDSFSILIYNPAYEHQQAAPVINLDITLTEDELLKKIEAGENVSYKTLLILSIRYRRIERILSAALKDRNIQDK